MLKLLHLQDHEKRFQQYGLFLFLLVSLFPLLSTHAKTHGYTPAITPDKDDYSPGQVAGTRRWLDPGPTGSGWF